MGQGAIDYIGVKGGLKLNDVIEEFKYAYKGQEIKAGDFVNYINGVASGSIGTDINAQVSEWSNNQAIEIDENRILITYRNKSDINILKCQIYSLENAQLIAGTTYSITSPTTDYLNIMDIAMLEDKRFVILGQSYNADTSSDYPLLFCGKIEGNTIIFGTAKSYLSNYSNFFPYSLCYVSGNKLIMGSAFLGNDRRVNCHIFSISDLTLPNSFTSVYNPSYYYCRDLRIRKISDTKVLIVWNNSSKSYIYTTIGTISDNTLSTSTIKTITSTPNLRNALSLSENLNLIIYTTDSSLPIIATYTTDIVSSNLLNTTNIPKIIPLAEDVGVLKTSENSIILAYGGTSDVNYSVAILPITNITENSATIGTTYLYPSTSKVIRDIINFQTNIIALLSSYQDPTSNSTGSSYLNLFSIGETISNQIIQAEYEQQVTPSTQPPFDGIALSSGVGGDDTGHNEQVKIARPTPKPVLKQGDIIPKTWTANETGYFNGNIQITASREDIENHNYAYLACDGSSTHSSASGFDSTNQLDNYWQIDFGEPKKITKLKISVFFSNQYWDATIQGSNDANDWVDLCTLISPSDNAPDYTLYEKTLSNTDFYRYYRAHAVANKTGYGFYIYELQTSEYEVLE